MAPDRVEHDSMGDVRVPAEALWGAQTQRAVENFAVSGRPLPPELVHALGLIKAEAARVNRLPPRLGPAIAAAADEVAGGLHDEQFPVDVFQTGSGTSSNMNANEVIARLAAQRLGTPVHPNDHVNMSQSSNDVFPSAVQLAAALAIANDLTPAAGTLAKALRAKQRAFARIVKSGRTHLMDATPVTLGQEFGGYAAQVEDGIARLSGTLPRLGALPLGGTAVGTGINAPKGFARKVVARLAERTGLPLTEAQDHFAAQGARDALVEASAQLRGLAVALVKIANDLRWMSSGPHAGLAEIHLPDLQPGSSIMPGKVNPVVPEVVIQVGAQVIGNDVAVAFGGSQGNFELNVYVPMIARNVLESIELLANACRLLADRCVKGIEANVETLRRYAEASPAIATALNPYLGYETTADIVQESSRTGKSIRAIVTERGLLTEEQLDRVLDVEGMTRGGRA
ncbi:MAG TPA: class II fumarate hydratase [Acidimicrobiia bacterium]|nr:class II fumarate hydratase [Acidimicrobiia bacterium]